MDKTPAKRTYRKFDETFKREAVQNWLFSGKSADLLAGELGINSNLLYAWRKSFAPATLAEALARIEADQREIRHLREQRDILKKTLGILSEPSVSVTNGSTR